MARLCSAARDSAVDSCGRLKLPDLLQTRGTSAAVQAAVQTALQAGGRVRREQRGGRPVEANGRIPEQAAGAPEQAAGRRAAGALESAILGVLWSAQGALSPGDVRESLARTDVEGAALSYSTVVTI